MQFFLLNLLLLYTTNHNYTVPPTEGNRGGLPLSINAPDKIIWSAVPGCRYPSLPFLPVGSSRSSPVVSNASMLDLIIIALFAGFLGIFTYDFFTKKKTEVNAIASGSGEAAAAPATASPTVGAAEIGSGSGSLAEG